MKNLYKIALLAPLAAATALISACPDSQGRYDEFGAKTEDARKGATNNQTPNNSVQVDFSGRYFLSIATSLAPTTPLYFDTTVTVDENFVVNFSFQPVKTDLDPFAGNMPRPDARTPVGDPIVVGNVQLTEEGTFSVTLTDANVAGAANPISGGDIVATIELSGFVTSATAFCGTAAGQVSQPTLLNLAGSTFGAGIVDDDTIGDFEPIAKCEGGVIPEPDMGEEDMGNDMDEDMGPVAKKRCPGGLEGEYLLTFKADVQGTRNQVGLTLVTNADPSICYTGTVNSLTDDSEIGTVEYAVEIDGMFTTHIPDFTIPPGASPILPNGGVVKLDLFAAHWTTEGQCGDLFFALQAPPITSDGGFAMIRANSDKFTIQTSDTAATCTAIIPNESCGLDAFAGNYDFKFETASSAGNPTLVSLQLATHPLTCLQGAWVSKTDGTTVVATVQEVLPIADDQIQINMRNFGIPPGANPVLPNGGAADVTITSTVADSADPKNMCGTLVVNLFDPFVLASAGTFAAEVGSEPAEPRCP